MGFTPHTDRDVAEMLAAIGAADVQALFDEIPASLHAPELDLPPALNEMATTRLLRERAARDAGLVCFAGAGAYEHHIPAAVWQITTRGEFYSAYTPYQAEASQGTLQVIYEYQSMIAALTGLEIANASLYDGASAVAEAILMAVRANKRSQSKRILLPRSLPPSYRAACRTIVGNQNLELIEIPFDPKTGAMDQAALDRYADDDLAAVVIAQPNVFGVLDEVDALTDWAHRRAAMVIAVVNPISLGLLKPPGEWGQRGADIACGDGQPLGVPMSSGGPYFGFFACRKEHVRQLPGRLVARATDTEGKAGFVLTLQAREQHIRRSKATSNICTNQGLAVTAATIHMAMMGPEGLERVAAHSHANTQALTAALTALPGVEPVFGGPTFHEALLRLPRPVQPLLDELIDAGLLAGVDMTAHYPELGDTLLVCATETRTPDDIALFRDALAARL